MRSMRCNYLIALLTTLACACITGSARAQDSARQLDDYLRTTVGLDVGQIADAEKGRVVVKLLHTDINRDVTVFGIVGIPVSRQAFVKHMHDTRSLVAARAQRFGLIGDSTAATDLQPLVLDPSEWKDLKSCNVNDCDFKLPVSIMREFSQSVKWDGPNAQSQVDSVMRSVIQNLVSAYRARGNSAMLRYDDTNGVQASDAFAALLGQSTSMRDWMPAVFEYLANYPASRPDSMREVMYWAADKIPHLRPTLTLNQLLVYTPASGMPVLARKQIYADHYFEAALELSTVFDAPRLAAGPGIYVVSVRRYRFDSLPRGLFNIRGRVRSQLQQLMKSDLESVRKAAEVRAG